MQDNVFNLVRTPRSWTAITACPFCGVAYYSIRVTYPESICDVCKGSPLAAKQAEAEVEGYLLGTLKNWPRDQTLADELERCIQKLAAGFWRGEYRAFRRTLTIRLEDQDIVEALDE